MGIVSLLGLSMFARFKEGIGVDFNFNSLFFGYPSIGHRRAFFLGLKVEVKHHWRISCWLMTLI
jgi:hypothetical protein